MAELRSRLGVPIVSFPRSHRWFEAVAVSFLLLTGIECAFAAVVDPRDYGAKGDGVAIDTAAIQKAIDTCSAAGGGTVGLSNGQFVSGTILLKNNVTLDIGEKAALLGSTNIADYQAPDKFRSGNNAEMGHCFIGAVNVTNVGVTGSGIIDGRGKELLDARPEGNRNRPFLARFVRCDGVALAGVRLRGSAAWTVHLAQSRNVKVERLSINSRGLPNNDGIDIDSSEHVRISDSDIDTGDDAICLKATSRLPSHDIEVTGCQLKSHWAAIKFGTESAGDFENIRITKCAIRDTQGGGIKLLSVDGAHLQNVLVSDLTMENVNLPVFIRLGARLRTFREGETPRDVGTVSNVVIKNIRAEAISATGILISGIPGHPVRDVTLENVSIKLPGGGAREDAGVVLEEKESAYPEITMFGKRFPACGLYARHVQGLKAAGVKLELAAADFRPVILCHDAEQLEFTNWSVSGTADPECLVRLESVRKATLNGLNLSDRPRVLLCVEGKDSRAIALKSVTSAESPVRLGQDVATNVVEIAE